MKRKHKIVIFRLCLALALTAFAFLVPTSGNKVLEIVLIAVPYLVIGYDILWSAVRNILRGQIFDENFLMTIATIGAFLIGEYFEAVGVMIFYQIGELFQEIAVGKSRRAIASLMDIRPDSATVLRGVEEITLSPSEVEVGEIIIVRVGEKIPLDGEIIEGRTTLNTSALTGESLPQDRGVGDRVISGSVNLTSLIKVKVESVYEESTVAKILELVENSASKKAKTENFITRFARYYTPAVVVCAVVLAILPPLAFGAAWIKWIERALIFLMVSCPCALVISVPLTFFGGIGGASKEGILIKGANYLEAVSQIDTLVFDKTGTLTYGKFRVKEIYSEAVSREELLEIAAYAECFSNHPVARSIVEAYGKEISKERIGEVSEIAGMGVSAEIDRKVVCVGNKALMEKAGAISCECDAPGTIIHICRDLHYLGYILIGDEIKKDTKEALENIKRKGIKKIVMLTGDSEFAAGAVADELSIDEVYAELLPSDKVECLEKLIGEGRKVGFVGDGINDAPVLSRADIGIAMGEEGSDAAIESADIVIMDDKLSKISRTLEISARTMRIVRQNIIFALAVKGIVLVLGALGLVNIWVAVLGDVGVMILAVLNAMRSMLKIKR